MIAAGLLAGTALVQTGVASAQSELVAADYTSPISANAEAIRSLNIMLMVTSLRCRTSAFDFRSEYDMFARAHQANLAEAHDTLARGLVATHGEDGSHRALDRIGVRIANRYGDGHPTLGCSDLKEATLQLAMSQDGANLSRMADRLLDNGSAQGAPYRQAGSRAQAPIESPAPRHEATKHRAQIPYELGSDTPSEADSELPDAMQLPLWQRG
jgi:hypothetical protein